MPLAREQRKLVAILFADAVGSSRLIGRDESGTVARLLEHLHGRLAPAAARCSGRVIRLTGDGGMVEFGSAVDALRAAIEFQQAMVDANRDQPDEKAIEFRVGIHLGDVIVEGDNIYGDDVNVAARLEAEAPPGGIVVSRAVREAVEGRLKATLHALGELALKNIARPIRAFRVEWSVEDWRATDELSGPASGAPASLQGGAPEKLSPPRLSIVVLPFANIGGGPEQASFINGIVRDLTIDLSKFPSLRVVSHSSTAMYHQQPFDRREMARELDVQYVVEGSVEETCERLRVTAQLTEAISGTQLWAERFDINPVDLRAARDEISMMIVGSLIVDGGPLNKAEHQRAIRTSPDMLTARDLYYRAEAEFLKFEQEANRRARALLERSLVLDPGSVAGHALLAWVHRHDVQFFGPECSAQSLDLAHREARTALELDPADYRGHWVLGAVLRMRREWDAAMAQYERAFDLNQNDPDMIADWAEFLSLSGRADEAVAQIRRAMKLHRLHPDWYIRVLARACYNTRQYEEAIRLGRRFQNPRVSVLENVAASYGQLGRNEEAAEMIERILAIKPDHSIAFFIADNPEMGDGVLQHFVEGLRKAGFPER